MKANLYINYYVDKQRIRQREIDLCLIANIKNLELDQIVIIINESDLDYLTGFLLKHGEEFDFNCFDKITIIKNEERPSYNYYFKLTEDHPEDINIISNSDIVIPHITIKQLKKWLWNKHCMALTRWDFNADDMSINNATFYNRIDSQDTWITKGAFKQIKGADFSLGIMGCDNKIAYLLSAHYNVINPSWNIKTFHYHKSGLRNYVRKGNIGVVPPPYKTLKPIKLYI